MERMIVKSRIGRDGVLQIVVPLTAADANQDVQVTIEPLSHRALTQEEWRNHIMSTAGSIADPTFIRHGQSEFERREVLP